MVLCLAAAVAALVLSAVPGEEGRRSFARGAILSCSLVFTLVAVAALRKAVRPHTAGALEGKLATTEAGPRVPDEARAWIAAVRAGMRSRRGLEEALLPRLRKEAPGAAEAVERVAEPGTSGRWARLRPRLLRPGVRAGDLRRAIEEDAHMVRRNDEHP